MWCSEPQGLGLSERVSKTKVLLNDSGRNPYIVLHQVIQTPWNLNPPHSQTAVHKLKISDITKVRKHCLFYFLYLTTAHCQILPVLENASLAPWEMGLPADVLSNKTNSQTRVHFSQVVILRNCSRAGCDSPHLALLLWRSLFFPTFSGRQLFARTAAAAIHRGGEAITKTQPTWRFFADPFLF